MSGFDGYSGSKAADGLVAMGRALERRAVAEERKADAYERIAAVLERWAQEL